MPVSQESIGRRQGSAGTLQKDCLKAQGSGTAGNPDLLILQPVKKRLCQCSQKLDTNDTGSRQEGIFCNSQKKAKQSGQQETQRRKSKFPCLFRCRKREKSKKPCKRSQDIKASHEKRRASAAGILQLAEKYGNILTHFREQSGTCKKQEDPFILEKGLQEQEDVCRLGRRQVSPGLRMPAMPGKGREKKGSGKSSTVGQYSEQGGSPVMILKKQGKHKGGYNQPSCSQTVINTADLLILLLGHREI